MVIKYKIDIPNKDILININRITNQIFKLLPCREEGGDWETPLKNLILEVVGINNLLDNKVNFFLVLTKMESLLTLTDENDFFMFRKVVFECLKLMNDIQNDFK